MIEKGKIVLEEPYRSIWKWGYLVINKEPRRNVILYNNYKDRATVSYARYMYEVSIGTFLPKDIYVDHIDGDKMNDSLSNYQLLSPKENNIKKLIQNNKTALMVEFRCGTCGEIFTRQRNNTHLVIPNKSTYCSRVCGSKRLAPSEIIRQFRKSYD